MACKRASTMSNGGLWEFPGGKIMKDEDERSCIIREIKEELDIDVRPAFRIDSFTHKNIELIPFIATSYMGTIQANEHEQVSFFNPSELPSLNWSMADIPLMRHILENLDSLKSRL